MKSAAAFMLAAAVAVSASDDCTESGGNWYCGKGVTQNKYNALDGSGSYSEVSVMSDSGECSFGSKSYGGPIAPFDEDLAAFFRGPINLKQFAVYTPGKGSSKREVTSKAHAKRHGHQHLHKKHHEEKRADMVTAVIDGQTQTWENNWFGSSTDAPVAAPTETAPTYSTAVPTSAPATPSKGGDSSTVPVGDYARVAYYDATSQVADGLVFLANKGDPSMSGTWSTKWGNSLSYVSSDAQSCAASPQVLADQMVTDAAEFAIYSDKECNGDCGAVREGSVAYKGFEGSTKAFFAEFSMPLTGKTGMNEDMPAAWLLNGKIARTGQYSECSCWKSGCGEADIFEILTPGETRAKSTFHFASSLGSSYYFNRPTTKTIKVATVFDESSSSATIRVLDDSFEFSPSLTSDDISNIVADETVEDLISLMTFGAF